MNLRYPNITGTTPAEQILQLKGYLYQLVEQLNLETAGAAEKTASVPSASAGKVDSGSLELTPTGMFNQVKSLVIKSADIVNAYYDEINRRLEGVYVAESDFGVFVEQTEQKIQETSTGIQREFEDLQVLVSGNLESVISAQAWVKQGLLFYAGAGTLEPELGVEIAKGTPVYGLEVGQEVEREGSKVFDTFARFTSYGATFYDQNRQLAAYITNKQFESPNVKIGETLTRGGYVETIDSNGGRVERWVGV